MLIQGGIVTFFIVLGMVVFHETENDEDTGISVTWAQTFHFSIVTMSTVGYGEITPQLPLAKRVCVMLGMIGPFYLSSFAGFIIAKYINSKNSKEHNRH